MLQAANDSAMRSESPLPEWMAEAPVPASTRKGSSVSLSSSSSGEALRHRSRAAEAAGNAGPSGAQQLEAKEAPHGLNDAHCSGDARPVLAGARAQAPAPLGAGHKQEGGPALAPPFVIAAREGRGRPAGRGGGGRAGQADPAEAEAPVRQAAAEAGALRAMPAQAKGRGTGGARGKATAKPTHTEPAIGSRAARSPEANVSREAERPLPAADGDIKAALALDGGRADGDAQAAAAAGPSRPSAGKVGKAQAPAGEVALVMPEKLPTKVRRGYALLNASAFAPVLMMPRVCHDMLLVVHK